MRFGEPLVEAVKRVAQDELGIAVSVGQLLGYIEYPSHYNNGLDSTRRCAWFTVLPDNMHDEQKEFLARHLDIISS